MGDEYLVSIKISAKSSEEKPGERLLGELIKYLKKDNFRIRSRTEQTDTKYWYLILVHDGDYTKDNLDKSLGNVTNRLDLSYEVTDSPFSKKSAERHVKESEKYVPPIEEKQVTR